VLGCARRPGRVRQRVIEHPGCTVIECVSSPFEPGAHGRITEVAGIGQRIIKTRCVTSRLLLKARATSSAMGIYARNVPRRWQRKAMVLRLARGACARQRLKRGNKVRICDPVMGLRDPGPKASTAFRQPRFS
jgi:hypothetical protein